MTQPNARLRACALAFLCAPALAFAATGAPDCANAATQADMNICAHQDFQRADNTLNRLYKEVLAKDSKHAGKLREAQRAWMHFRDEQCAYEAIGYGGASIEPLVRASCLAELTQQRNQTLERLPHNSNPSH